MTETPEKDLVERADEAMRRIGAMCSEGRGPRMSVPADHARDDDLFICDTIMALKASCESLRAQLEEMREERGQFITGLAIAEDRAKAAESRCSAENGAMREALLIVHARKMANFTLDEWHQIDAALSQPFTTSLSDRMSREKAVIEAAEGYMETVRVLSNPASTPDATREALKAQPHRIVALSEKLDALTSKGETE